MYQVITPSGPALWTGTLSDCLHHIAHSLQSHNAAHTVTVSQAVAAGYSISKA